jgi:peptidoglycan/xylan/chitin deacetylase (PgdA/CDA1 family)
VRLKDTLIKVRGRALRVAADVLPPSVLFQHGARTSKKIALTFDDGPGPLTLEYLDALERSNAKATFFVIGKNCAPHREALAAIASQGHDVAGHGWSHTPFTKLRHGALEEELQKTTAELPVRSRIVRPPYGKMTPRSLITSFRAGYSSAMWSVDPLDWQASTANDVVRAVDPKMLRGGDIVLLHEERPATLEALPEVIARIKDAGFELVTVSELVPLS